MNAEIRRLRKFVGDLECLQVDDCPYFIYCSMFLLYCPYHDVVHCDVRSIVQTLILICSQEVGLARGHLGYDNISITQAPHSTGN